MLEPFFKHVTKIYMRKHIGDSCSKIVAGYLKPSKYLVELKLLKILSDHHCNCAMKSDMFKNIDCVLGYARSKSVSRITGYIFDFLSMS